MTGEDAQHGISTQLCVLDLVTLLRRTYCPPRRFTICHDDDDRRVLEPECSTQSTRQKSVIACKSVSVSPKSHDLREFHLLHLVFKRYLYIFVIFQSRESSKILPDLEFSDKCRIEVSEFWLKLSHLRQIFVQCWKFG